MRVKLCFKLSMPGVGSWNGRWSGEGNLYARIRDISASNAAAIVNRSFSYCWSDGWAARIAVTQPRDAKERRKILKESKGFCGYDWMIDSIVRHGKIYATHEEPKITQTVSAPLLHPEDLKE